MYLNILQEVIDIMHHDYAGCNDKKGWDSPRKFEDKIRDLEKRGEVNANLFAEIVEDYLIDFKDPHMFFKIVTSGNQKEFDNGFKIRRFRDKLFVTSVGNEKRLNTGDTIISLDNMSVEDLVDKHRRELMETEAEREDWRKIIQKYSEAEVISHEGKHKSIKLEKYEKEDYTPKHIVTRIDSETLCMTLTDFFEADTLDKLIVQHKNELMSTKNLIIDVRINYGGSTLAYSSLEKYLFPPGSTKINFNDYATEFNCTDRNAELTIDLINQALENIDNKEYRKGLKRFRDETWVKNRGKGFISFNQDNEDVEIKGSDFPANIIVLTDNYCGSAGDIFVNLCKKSPKVTVVGRPTMGINDYSNLTIKRWNEKFEFGYPTSRLKSLDHRCAMTNPGIKPDVYIPWTPEHIYKDVDMEEAIRILRNKNLYN